VQDDAYNRTNPFTCHWADENKGDDYEISKLTRNGIDTPVNPTNDDKVITLM